MTRIRAAYDRIIESSKWPRPGTPGPCVPRRSLLFLVSFLVAVAPGATLPAGGHRMGHAAQLAPSKVFAKQRGRPHALGVSVRYLSYPAMTIRVVPARIC